MMQLAALLITAVTLIVLSGTEAQPSDDQPRSLDPRLEVVLFAKQPDIVHPVAITFDKKGRLLVVESHTHFRPVDYAGPKYDRIRMLEDTDGDGKADRFTTFYEGTIATMDIATHPDGSIYLATRNEILRLRDTSGSGTADLVERIAFLETKGNYPHNGLSGLAFDADGNLFFGLGENLGAAYKLTGHDGSAISDQGEGGNIFWCTARGDKLRRYATGFWNPFGVSVDSLGRVFAVDNDPDSMPPCRLLHIVEGGDYGYQFRYGRSGRHPFQSWNGQLPGTLPMVCGTGEAPCEVMCYESNGLPAEYFGQYLVTAWADHRLERYEVKEHGASYRAETKILVQGGSRFRPTGLAVAPDGSLFLGDWVLPDYALHQQGAIWQVRPRKPLTFTKRPLEQLRQEHLKRHSSKVIAKSVREKWKRNEDVTALLDVAHPGLARAEAIRSLNNETDLPALLKLHSENDPFIQHAVIQKLARSPWLYQVNDKSFNAHQRLALLLAQRASGQDQFRRHIPRYLEDADEDVRFLTAKWISDHAIKECQQDVVRALRSPRLSVRMTVALETALARLNDHEVSESKLADRFAEMLINPGITDEQRVLLLRLIPVNHPKLSTTVLAQWARSANLDLQQEAVLTLLLGAQPDRHGVLEKVATDPSLSDATRTLARLVQQNDPPPKMESGTELLRPAVNQPQQWLDRFGKDGNAQAGRRLFYHPQRAGCYRCHQVNGRGSILGPDLSTVGRQDSLRIMDSILQPSATVAPHYQSWTLAMHDGRILTGMLVHTYLDEYTYLDAQGKSFKVKTQDIAETKPSPKSIMPEGLMSMYTDQEVRDLLAYLTSLK